MIDDDDASGTLLKDFSLAIAAIFICLVILLPFINPPKKDEAQEIKAAGNIIIETIWDKETFHDVDTWVLGPDGIKVGYNNKSSPIFNLLRDDTGKSNDVTGLNYENTYSRGIPDGWYLVNLHMYAMHAGEVPVIVRVVLSIKEEPNSSVLQFYAADIKIYEGREEITVLRFRVKDKKIIRESFSTAYVPIVKRIEE